MREPGHFGTLFSALNELTKCSEPSERNKSVCGAPRQNRRQCDKWRYPLNDVPFRSGLL